MTQPSRKMEKAVAMKTTKRRTTQTLQGNPFKIDWGKEIDWDLLEQLDQEEEGQSIPMHDLVPTTASPQPSSGPLGQLVDEHPGPVPAMDTPPKGSPSRK